MTLDFRPGDEPVTQADFTYSITPDAISITDTGNDRASVKGDIEAVLCKIVYWHQGLIAGFKINHGDESGSWYSVRWDGLHASFFLRDLGGCPLDLDL